MTHDLQEENAERALLVQAVIGQRSKKIAEDSLAELARLADTAGAEVVGSITQRRPRPTTTFFIGEGKLADVKMACQRARANLVIVDNELTAVQVNSLDLSLGVKVIDRTELILQIFARRARSSEAQIQVELAQLQYLVSRIPVSQKQQRFQGGIGMRGPGESPFQLRNAPMRRRIKDLKKKLGNIQKRRSRTRERRPWPLVSLVGYTNAGKSTLLNAFSPADAYVDDRLFATLDTKSRRVRLPSGADIMLTDTVGFIRHLPHGLVASFRSTLEEVAGSDLLLHVADASHSCVLDHIKLVEKTLGEIKAESVPQLLLLNKSDSKDAAAAMPDLMERFPDAVAISARRDRGLDVVRESIAGLL
jgi:GTP-binding protein HflX